MGNIILERKHNLYIFSDCKRFRKDGNDQNRALCNLSEGWIQNKYDTLSSLATWEILRLILVLELPGLTETTSIQNDILLEAVQLI